MAKARETRQVQKFALMDERCDMEEVMQDTIGDLAYNGLTPIYVRRVPGFPEIAVMSNMPITAEQAKKYFKEQDGFNTRSDNDLRRDFDL